MKWVITMDVESPKATAVGAGDLGEGVTLHTITPQLLRGLPHRFRLLDDDGLPYYAGQADEHEFAPLDWAKGYAGCTEIQFAKGDAWETL